MSSLITHADPVPATERLDSVTLRSVDGSTEAEFVPETNMVCSSLRYLGAEYLHQGAGVEAYAKDGMTMGIPLLHPWANRLNGFHYRVGDEDVALPQGENVIPLDDVGLPIHGGMPTLMRWEAIRFSDASLTSRLRWTTDELLRLFPFPHLGTTLGSCRRRRRRHYFRQSFTRRIRASGSDASRWSRGYRTRPALGSR